MTAMLISFNQPLVEHLRSIIQILFRESNSRWLTDQRLWLEGDQPTLDELKTNWLNLQAKLRDQESRPIPDETNPFSAQIHHLINSAVSVVKDIIIYEPELAELPVDARTSYRAEMENLGFLFAASEPDSDYSAHDFIPVGLPFGWKYLNGELIDAQNRLRAIIDYKHGFPMVFWCTFFHVTEFIVRQDGDVYTMSIVARDSGGKGKTVFTSRSKQVTYKNRAEQLQPQYHEAYKWLDEHFPDWRTDFAYWD
ncbi:TPA: hypothetical protein DF272_00720 [Candidatus Falkowbacteria bacterium]|nr:hypothetical protein [Candidatus Falkowbacteria bacterium]